MLSFFLLWGAQLFNSISSTLTCIMPEAVKAFPNVHHGNSKTLNLRMSVSVCPSGEKNYSNSTHFRKLENLMQIIQGEELTKLHLVSTKAVLNTAISAILIACSIIPVDGVLNFMVPALFFQ